MIVLQKGWVTFLPGSPFGFEKANADPHAHPHAHMHMQMLNGGLGGVGFNPTPPLSVYSKVSLNPAPIDRPSLSLPLGGIRDVGVPPVEGCRESHAGVRPRTLLDLPTRGGELGIFTEQMWEPSVPTTLLPAKRQVPAALTQIDSTRRGRAPTPGS